MFVQSSYPLTSFYVVVYFVFIFFLNTGLSPEALESSHLRER